MWHSDHGNGNDLQPIFEGLYTWSVDSSAWEVCLNFLVPLFASINMPSYMVCVKSMNVLVIILKHLHINWSFFPQINQCAVLLFEKDIFHSITPMYSIKHKSMFSPPPSQFRKLDNGKYCLHYTQISTDYWLTCSAQAHSSCDG